MTNKIFPIEIGVVKDFNKEKGYGYITKLQSERLFFQHSKLKGSLNSGDIVGFEIRQSNTNSNKSKMFSVKLASNYLEALNDKFNQPNLHDCERYLILKAIPEIYNSYLSAKNSDLNKFDVDEYINNFDVSNDTANYNIEIKTRGRWKPGDDDSAYVEYHSRDEVIRKGLRDKYIDSFLFVYKTVYSETAFNSWTKMIDDLQNDVIRWTAIVEKEQLLREQNIEKLTKSYNKKDHRNSIIEEIEDSVQRRKLSLDQEMNQYTKFYFN